MKYLLVTTTIVSPSLGWSSPCLQSKNQGCVYFLFAVEVGLQYVASPGFPGQYTSTGGALISRNFVPQGVTGYSYIRFHQFGLPATTTLLVSSTDRNETIQGNARVSEYWISSGNNPIQISFQLLQENIESLGFLLEFGGKLIK